MSLSVRNISAGHRHQNKSSRLEPRLPTWLVAITCGYILDMWSLETIKGILHNLFGLFVVVPYFTLEAIALAIFGARKEPKSVKGEVVVITGTGHGIGKLLAIKYATEGATVVCWDVNEKLNNETVDHIKKLGHPNVYGYTVDVANRENVMETARKVQNAVGDVTILINNAGIMPHHSFLQHTEAEIRRIMDINVMGHFWTVQAFLPTMAKNNRGHIVALSSMAGLVGLMNVVPYNASKFAVRGLMEGLHAEFRRNPNNKLCFTTVYPFIVDTGLVKNMDVTYPTITRVLTPQFVADEIFKGQVYNERTVILPKDISVLLYLRNTFWPEKAVNYFTDNLRCDLLSDLEAKKQN